MNIAITGASKGIGKAIAEKFAANGYDLFLCARTEQDLQLLAQEITSANKNIQVYYRPCDVAIKQQVKEFADWVLAKADKVDVLINNAGIFIQGHVHQEEDGVLEQLMATNLYSAYYLSRFLIPSMIRHKSGHIFNICSIASLKAYQYGGSYGITKYAMAGLSANLRDELKHHNIKVTSVFPGAAYTDSWNASGVDPNRIMKAEDIAEMIYTAAHLSPMACVEEIVIRPQLGDL
jgi:short-subunit dehydrogenase